MRIIKLETEEVQEILDFEKERGFELLIYDAGEDFEGKRYSCKFDRSTSEPGIANSIDEAIRNYCKNISNTTVSFSHPTPLMPAIIIEIPKLKHTKYNYKFIYNEGGDLIKCEYY